jgi:hypothetical protein
MVDNDNDFFVLQPSDIRNILGVKTDEEFDLILKSWRFLFDFLFAAKDGTQINSNLVKFTKCGNLGVLASCGDRNIELEFNPVIDKDDLFDEILGVISDNKIVKLPTI